MKFLNKVKGSVDQIDCMIEAKKKDDALFHLMDELEKEETIEKINESTFFIH
jgi:UV DNA damage endonuclease